MGGGWRDGWSDGWMDGGRVSNLGKGLEGMGSREAECLLERMLSSLSLEMDIGA